MTTPNPKSESPRRICWPGLVVLFVALAIAYSNSLHVPLIFDDTSSIVENSTLRHWSTAFFPPGDSGLTVSGRPVVNLSLALNYALGGEQVFGYHLFNLIIHAAVMLAVFALSRRILAAVLKDDVSSHGWALAVAAMWGLHPLQTESVTYVVQRAESLVGLFYVLTLYFLVRAIGEPQRALWKWGAVAMCAVGMATKEVMVTAPVLALLLDRTFFAGSFREAWRLRKRLYLSLGATWAVLAICMISTGGRGSTVGFTTEATAFSYGLTQCKAIVRYLQLAVWPDGLLLDYGVDLVTDFPAVALEALLMLVIVATTIVGLWKKPLYAFFPAAFLLILAPTSSVVPVVTQTIAEHRMYLALLPLVAGLLMLVRRLQLRSQLPGAGVWTGMLLAGVCLALAARTYCRNRDYRTAESIWRDVTEKCPDNYRGWESLAGALPPDRLAEKADFLSRAVSLNPEYPPLLVTYGGVLQQMGSADQAIALIEVALQQRDGLPKKMEYQALSNLGAALVRKGRTGEALERFRAAIALDPASGTAHYNLADAYLGRGEIDAAMKEYRLAMADPRVSPMARNRLARLLLQTGANSEALAMLREGVRLHPADTSLGILLSQALTSMGRLDEAVDELARMQKTVPNVVQVRVQLGNLLKKAGQAERALEQFEAAVALRPDDPALLALSGRMLLEVGRRESGMQRLQQAFGRASDDPQTLGHVGDSLLAAGGADAQAAACYEAALSRGRPTVALHIGLGTAYRRLGRIQEALGQYSAALTLDPANAQLRREMESLREQSR